MLIIYTFIFCMSLVYWLCLFSFWFNLYYFRLCWHIRSNISGCEFGDRRTCSRSDCDDPSRWHDCCSTCQDKITTSRVTSATAPRVDSTRVTTNKAPSVDYTTKIMESTHTTKNVESTSNIISQGWSYN